MKRETKVCQKCGKIMRVATTRKRGGGRECYLVLLLKDLATPERKGKWWCFDCTGDGIWTGDVAQSWAA